MLLEHRRVARRLSEAAVEACRTTSTGHLHVGSVKRESAGLIHVETVVQHPTDYPSRLADAKDQHLSWRRVPLERVVTKIGEQITDACKTRSGDIRIFGHVGQLIDHAGL